MTGGTPLAGPVAHDDNAGAVKRPSADDVEYKLDGPFIFPL